MKIKETVVALISLGGLFVLAKVTGVISWSWLWVLCPWWLMVAAVIIVGVTVFSYCAVVRLVNSL